MFGFTQGEGKLSDNKIYNGITFIGEFNGETRAEIIERDEFRISSLDIEGKIKGTIDISDKTIDGKLEKGRIKGTATITYNTDNTVNEIKIEGKIEGIFKGSKEGQPVERIIKGDFDDKRTFTSGTASSPRNTPGNNKVFGAIKIETSLGGIINNATVEDDSHYNTFKICKKYIENAPESDYQLWPVKEDPNVS
jgi:hypothetical protein